MQVRVSARVDGPGGICCVARGQCPQPSVPVYSALPEQSPREQDGHWGACHHRGRGDACDREMVRQSLPPWATMWGRRASPAPPTQPREGHLTQTAEEPAWASGTVVPVGRQTS